MKRLALLPGLLLPAIALADGGPWCWNADEVTAVVSADTVRIAHSADYINCCPDPIVWDVQVGDATIFVEERSQTPCNCDCCYDLEVALANVPAGPWNVLYRWFDLENGDWVDRVLMIEVPDVGQTYVPFVAGQSASGCLNQTGAEGGSPDPVTWAQVKALYR
jgi:hypothetical protein